MTEQSPSLRERHRARTADEIHRAALDLSEQDGYTATTVEAIARRAGISRRTFFNYYASKEDAVLGLLPTRLQDAALEEFLDPERGDEFTRIVRLFVTVLRDSSGPPELAERRRELVDNHPELKRRIGHNVAAAESLVASVVAEHTGSPAAPRSPETSQAFVLLAGSVLKYTYRTNPSLFHSDDAAEIDHALDAAIAVFRTALKEIS